MLTTLAFCAAPGYVGIKIARSATGTRRDGAKAGQALSLARHAGVGRHRTRRHRHGLVGCPGTRSRTAAGALARWHGKAAAGLRSRWLRWCAGLCEGGGTLGVAR